MQGSQNYGLDYDGSDIDTKCIILPKFEDFTLNKKPESFTYVMENNEHLDIKDIRCMFECFKKQNSNFVEILFTDYYIINPKYETFIKKLFNHAEEIARYDEVKFLNCCVGMAFEKKKAMCHPYPATKDKIDKYGYDGKQVSHILRMRDLVYKYCCGRTFDECLMPIKYELIMDYKLNKIPLETALTDADKFTCVIKKLKDEYIETKNPTINENVKQFLDKFIYDILKQKFKEELINE